ncbi:hypothetical protein [Chitinophaga rhizosphaerae]|nr:hypothetical protein [Chitinophaga rhizosphaerae]
MNTQRAIFEPVSKTVSGNYFHLTISFPGPLHRRLPALPMPFMN